MVIKTKPKMALLPKGLKTRLSGNGPAAAGGAGSVLSDLIVVKTQRGHAGDREELEDAEDIIDLGAPRLRRADSSLPTAPRRLSSYTPNPRLYPGPANAEPKGKRGKEGRGRRHKRVYKRPVPNARLYRPAPPRVRPPPAPWRGAWPPPAPPAPALATASLAALQLTQSRPEPATPRAAHAPPHAPLSRRLVVTLPAQRHTMEAAPRTPDEGSDGNDPVSAPSEFLAEFLSAIMQRQYAEALKYCRLILQYEPHNATARGFHSLLQHKVAAAPAAAPPTPPTPPSPLGPHSDPACGRCGSSSADSSPRRAARAAPRRLRRLAVDMPLSASHEEMEQEADESASSSSPGGAACGAACGSARRDVSRSRSGSESDDSCASQSSLELDSSPSLSLSRRTDRTDRTDSASGSGAGWESTGTPPSSGSLAGGDARAPDDNGNAPASPGPTVTLHADDMQNDNGHTVPIKGQSSSESLRRLRAQFACSIK